jgi:hypothetical protein
VVPNGVISPGISRDTLHISTSSNPFPNTKRLQVRFVNLNPAEHESAPSPTPDQTDLHVDNQRSFLQRLCGCCISLSPDKAQYNQAIDMVQPISQLEVLQCESNWFQFGQLPAESIVRVADAVSVHRSSSSSNSGTGSTNLVESSDAKSYQCISSAHAHLIVCPSLLQPESDAMYDWLEHVLYPQILLLHRLQTSPIK